MSRRSHNFYLVENKLNRIGGFDYTHHIFYQENIHIEFFLRLSKHVGLFLIYNKPSNPQSNDKIMLIPNTLKNLLFSVYQYNRVALTLALCDYQDNIDIFNEDKLQDINMEKFSLDLTNTIKRYIKSVDYSKCIFAEITEKFEEETIKGIFEAGDRYKNEFYWIIDYSVKEDKVIYIRHLDKFTLYYDNSNNFNIDKQKLIDAFSPENRLPIIQKYIDKNIKQE